MPNSGAGCRSPFGTTLGQVKDSHDADRPLLVDVEEILTGTQKMTERRRAVAFGRPKK